MNPNVNWRIQWPASDLRFLYVDCHSGLGNRIKTLVSAIRVQKAMPNHQFVIGWRMDGYHCHCPFNSLFANPFLVLSGDFFSTTGYIDHHSVRTTGPNFISPESKADVVWVSEENFFYLTGDRGVMWGQHGPFKMKNASLREELLSCFDKLVFHPVVQQAVNHFVHEHFRGRPVLGVHIRRGDNDWANRFVPDSLFPAAIEDALGHFPDDTLIFLCSDSPETEQYIARGFPNRVISYRKRTLPNARSQSTVAVQDALIEIGILSRTSLIVRTPSSTFSQCAAWMGRVPTIEVGPLEHEW